MLNLQKPYQKFDCPAGPWDTSTKGADFIVQDEILYAWSESNLRYEEVWWLDPNSKETDLVKRLRKERPGPKGFENYTLVKGGFNGEF